MRAGILLHISSLQSPYGIGTLGKEAYRFVDFLKSSEQSYWQILPINPTSIGDSPYQSPSVFAFNPYFIDLDFLVNEKLINKSDLEKIEKFNNSEKVPYGYLFETRMEILKLAYNNFSIYEEMYFDFKTKNRKWIFSYGVFCFLKEKHGYVSWNNWPDEYRFVNLAKVEKIYEENKIEIERIMFVQFLFYKQWSDLKTYANENGVKIIGDIPIYVAYDSVDVWLNPDIFELDSKKLPKSVAGCPPDDFAKKGQLWGNPLYDWEYIKKTNYKWWIERMNQAMELFDIVRIDHFRGFSAYYSIKYGNKTAVKGKWIKGPGAELFRVIEKNTTRLDVIAEDLGFIDDDVVNMLWETGYPGMKIFQFEISETADATIERFKNFSKNTVLYTGTHDNLPIVAWYNKLDKKYKKVLKQFLGYNGNKVHEAIIKCCYQANSKIVIIPLQDFLGLDEKARMNIPSTLEGNWLYRVNKNDLSKSLTKKIKEITEEYGREQSVM